MKIRPPRLATWLADRWLPHYATLHGTGDLEEIFHRIAKTEGPARARRWYWKQLIASTLDSLINRITWRIAMLKNLILIALRNIKRHKGYAFINILGLALGMAVSILIANFILFETSFDRHHEKSDRIYRLALDGAMGGNTIVAPISSAPTAPLLKADFPEIEDAVRFAAQLNAVVTYEDRQFSEENVLFSDAAIFKVFTLPLVSGDPETALKSAYSVVISQEMAAKYFGDADPMGQVLTFNQRDRFTVTGVMRNLPATTHLHYDMLCAFETLYAQNPEAMAAWTPFNYYTYVLLKPGVSAEALEAKLSAFVDQHMAQLVQGLGGNIRLFFQPLTSIHLHSHLEYDTANGNIHTVYLFAAIAGIILAIACINFMNLATARSAQRAREVGIRKVLGSERKALIRQFLGESLVYSLVSLLIALTLAWLGTPLLRSLSGIDFSLDLGRLPWLIPGYILLAGTVGLLAGTYPAFFLSSFKPVKVLRSRSSKTAGSQGFRNGLVVVQFTISIALMVGTAVITRQLQYMKTQNLGFDKEQVAVLPILNSRVTGNIDEFKTALLQSPLIMEVSASSHVPGYTPWLETAIPEGYSDEETVIIRDLMADESFVPTLGMELVAGRNFSREIASDRDEAILINETAAHRYGWGDPLGKTIRIRYRNTFVPKTVIGVFKDFHMVSLHNVIEPMFIGNENRRLRLISVRIRPGAIPEALAFIKKTWRQFDPDRPPQYFFLDQHFDASYRTEERLNALFSCFTGFALFIASLGLFGLASFSAEQRTKEIGIRKVMGSSTGGIVLMLLKDFTQWVVLANIIAWPVTFLLMRRWLEAFAYRTAMPWSLFLLSGVAALMVAVLTVSGQALKAALSNPIRSLRWE